MSSQPAIDYIDKDGFRANVGIVLTRGSGKYSWRPRRRPRLAISPRSVNRGERVEEALFRELKEEIGLEREMWRCWAPPAAGCGIACLDNMSATAASDRSSAGFCSSSSLTNRSCDSIPPQRRSSIAGAGPTTGRRCAKSSISSGGFTSGRFTISAN